MLNLSKKKKKKKTQTAPAASTSSDATVPENESSIPVSVEGSEINGKESKFSEGDDGNDDDEGDDDDEDELSMDLSSKKKKSKKQISFGQDEILGEEGGGAPSDTQMITGLDDLNAPWQGLDRDYEYKEMLSRIVARLRASNPDLVGAPRKFAVKPPQVHREGKQKAVFVNFMEICKGLKREPDHLLAFLLAELGTTGSIDGSKRLIIRGRLQQKHIESILRRYIAEYVTCSLCRSPHTRLVKENRLFFLRCENCGASRSVAPVKSGYVAQVGKRKKVG